jgi:hypothetical protein
MSMKTILTNGAPLPKSQNDEAAVSSRRSNTSSGGFVVQKFGGTSVGKFAVNIAEDIVRYVRPNL